MKSVNGGLLETLETDKYKIIVDDALKWLEKYKVRKERLERGVREIEKIIFQIFSGTLVILCPIATRCPQF